jgi:hypothetical protein
MPTESNATADNATAVDKAPIPGEILAAIVAAATVFIGKNIHLRAVEELDSTHRSVSRWSRQGRVLVQSSHILPKKH